MRTAGLFLADTPHTGGLLWYGAASVNVVGADWTYTRNAAGDYSMNLPASKGPEYIIISLDDLKRFIESTAGFKSGMPFQEQFGTGAGGPGWPAPAPGMPPFTGATELTPPTGDTPKGVRVNKIVLACLITGATLTTHTMNLYRTTYANNVANSVATPAISVTMPTTVQTNPYIVTATITTPIFETTDLTDVIVEIAVTTAGSGAYRFYGVGFYVDFNYN